jgi:DNA-binding NarL/FixJ family response regulator
MEHPLGTASKLLLAVFASECQPLAEKNFAGGYVRPRAVLIVDDNPTVRRLICELFTHEGDFEVCGEAENGKDAIEKAQLLRPALIITDLSMPEMNGLDATRALKKLMPHVPVILYTIHADAALIKAALAAGASAVLRKEEAATVLVKTARELLDKLAA